MLGIYCKFYHFNVRRTQFYSIASKLYQINILLVKFQFLSNIADIWIFLYEYYLNKCQTSLRLKVLVKVKIRFSLFNLSLGQMLQGQMSQ